MEKLSLLRTDKEVTDIYYRNVQSVFRVALMYLGNISDAEDVVQNVFMKFIDSEPQFQNEGHEKAWFITVTKNMCKNILKSIWRTKREDIEGIELSSYVEAGNEESGIMSKIMELKPNYRIAVYLYYYEEFSVREIGELLNKSDSTIQTWLARGREKLRIELGGEAYEA